MTLLWEGGPWWWWWLRGVACGGLGSVALCGPFLIECLPLLRGSVDVTTSMRHSSCKLNNKWTSWPRVKDIYIYICVCVCVCVLKNQFKWRVTLVKETPLVVYIFRGSLSSSQSINHSLLSSLVYVLIYGWYFLVYGYSMMK